MHVGSVVIGVNVVAIACYCCYCCLRGKCCYVVIDVIVCLVVCCFAIVCYSVLLVCGLL